MLSFFPLNTIDFNKQRLWNQSGGKGKQIFRTNGIFVQCVGKCKTALDSWLVGCSHRMAVNENTFSLVISFPKADKTLYRMDCIHVYVETICNLRTFEMDIFRFNTENETVSNGGIERVT